MTFTVSITGWTDGAAIPEKFAFCKPDAQAHVALSENLNPEIAWANAPAGTQSFALICHDPDVPSVGDDVNQAGKTVPSDLPRVDFYHWVLVNIPANVNKITEGVASNGVTAKGKTVGLKDYGLTGINDYTAWFAGDADMGGNYGDYDGPCPPWNDSIVHHYHFTVYALDVESVNLSGNFMGGDVLKAIEGHVLAKGSYVGVYSLNPEIS